MGIDLLDVSFRLEKSFGLKLDRDFWDKLYQHATRVCQSGEPADITVQQIFDELVYRLKECDRYQAESTGLLDSIRTQVMHQLAILFPGREHTSNTRVTDLYQKVPTQEDWQSIRSRFSPSPERSHTSGLTATCVVLGFIGGPALTGAALSSSLSLWFAVPFILLGIVSLIGASVWRDHRRFPPSITTIEDLVTAVVEARIQDSHQEKATSGPGEQHRWSDEMIWFSLRSVLVDALGVDHDEVKPNARLIHDLGAQ